MKRFHTQFKWQYWGKSFIYHLPRGDVAVCRLLKVVPQGGLVDTDNSTLSVAACGKKNFCELFWLSSKILLAGYAPFKTSFWYSL